VRSGLDNRHLMPQFGKKWHFSIWLQPTVLDQAFWVGRNRHPPLHAAVHRSPAPVSLNTRLNDRGDHWYKSTSFVVYDCVAEDWVFGMATRIACQKHSPNALFMTGAE